MKKLFTFVMILCIGTFCSLGCTEAKKPAAQPDKKIEKKEEGDKADAKKDDKGAADKKAAEETAPEKKADEEKKTE